MLRYLTTKYQYPLGTKFLKIEDMKKVNSQTWEN